MLTSDSYNAQRLAKKASDDAATALSLPLLALGLPLLPPWVALLSGLTLGVRAAIKWKHAEDLLKPRIVHDKHRGALPKAGRPAEHLYLGESVGLDDWKDGYYSYLREHDVGRSDLTHERAYEATMLEHFSPFSLSDDSLMRHVAVVGSTGHGKTELYLAALYQQMQRGGGALVWDPKSSGDLIVKVMLMAEATGRLQDVRILSPEHAYLSHTYTPLVRGSARHTISTVMKMDAKTKEEFFRNVNRFALTAAVLCLEAQPDKPAFNFGDLGVLFNDPYKFLELFLQVPEKDTEARSFVWQFLKNYVTESREGEIVFDVQKYRDRLQGLATNMFSLSHSEYAKVINDYSPDIELREAILSNQIVIISASTLADKEGVELFGKLTMADLARAVGQIDAERAQPMIPFLFMADEYGSIAEESQVELTQLARSAHVSLWLAVQGKGFLDQVDPVFTSNQLSNCWTQVYFDVRDPDTRDFAIRLAGQVVRRYEQDSQTMSRASSNRNYESGQLRTENTSQTYAKGTKEVKEDAISAEDFSLDPGVALVLTKYGRHRVRLPIMTFEDELPEMDTLPVPRPPKRQVRGLNLLERVLEEDAFMMNQLRAQAAARNPNFRGD